MYKVVEKITPKSRIASEKNNIVEVSVSSKEYIFSQTTIISSVMLESGTHLIKPETSKFVNSNGDCWSNESCRANYKSFLGAFNYVNHVQEEEKSVGFIADAILRRIPLNSEDNVFVYYVDILVATHRDNIQLCKYILNGEVEYLSMGCDAMISQCSKCGEKYKDETTDCECLTNNKGKYYIDQQGQKRIIAEILGDKNEGSCVFIEASWLLQTPAFKGAAIRNVLSMPKDAEVILNLPKECLERPAMKKYFRK